MQGIAILGSTGTIGVNTLDVVSRNPGQFRVVALSARSNVARMAEQCEVWRPALAAMADPNAAERLAAQLRLSAPEVQVIGGPDAAESVACHPAAAQVMAGIVGAAGLLPTLAAARAGKRVLLANKEALVMSGALFMQAVHAHDVELLPIDSEHNAIFQCMPPPGTDRALAQIRKVLLTGSGGPFRTRAPDSLHGVTPDEACAHPNWVMGRKISVDSATMMNKGLEVIEACWLFGIGVDEVQVVVHPQSVIHSMVEYVDGSVLAELGHPDMRTPIAHALAWPERAESGVGSLDFFSLGQLQFEAPDFARFPCLRLCIEAARAGGDASTILNAANEVAVESFLNGNLRFPHIARVVEQGLEAACTTAPSTIEAVLAVDALARERAREHVGALARAPA
ncbi:MAG: 1-deoxy-D-xylulose-5-phosphate reductoisomerase [Pseudomonadota bacterium]